ncbi:MAG: XRE family transcriptional regulator [Deltaproteobacteria bacterium]|nr:MAG: XRE family transcriptional regulator [Deltaproteobacteria bacterium]
MAIMPKKSKLNLPPLNLGEETLGKRIARLRKQNGLSQAQLAKKIGITPGLVSDYERNRLRPHAEMTARFALALQISADELLGLKHCKNGTRDNTASLKILRRVKRIETLPSAKQKILLQNIDMFLKGAEAER